MSAAVYSKSMFFITQSSFYNNKLSTSEEMLRYFQNTLWKREIGKLHAALYLAWADLEKATNGVENAVNILQKVSGSLYGLVLFHD